MYNITLIPGISADEHHAIYIECYITPIRNNQVPRELKLYSKTDWEGLKDIMSTVKGSCMATHSVDTQTDSMWNDLMTEVERALDDFVPKKIARTKDRVPWVMNKLKKQLRKQKMLFKKQRGSSKYIRASQYYKAYKRICTKTNTSGILVIHKSPIYNISK